MESTHPTAGWEQLGDRFYRKIQLYTAVFDQDLDLDAHILAGASYAGAIGMTLKAMQPLAQSCQIDWDGLKTALYRDENKLVAYRPQKSTKPSIDIYSVAGKLLTSISWDKGSIRGIGWSEDEKLLVVSRDGLVRCYWNLQGDFTQFSIGNGAEEYGVESCRCDEWSICAVEGVRLQSADSMTRV
jgi:vacuolar protein sorting-associated protein 16